MNTNSLFKKVSSLALTGATLSVSLISAAVFTSAPAVATSAKLEFTNTVDKQLADRGETLSYTLTVKNTGTTDVSNAYVWIKEPNLANYVAGSSNYKFQPDPNIVRNLTDAWIVDGVNFGTLYVGDTVTLKYQTKVAQNANNDNIIWSAAGLKSDQTETVQANSWTRVILKNPSLCASKTADKESVTVGDTVTFTIKVCNNGNVNITNIKIGDFINSPFSYVPGSTVQTIGNKTINVADTWLQTSVNIGNLNPGQEVTLTFKVTVTKDLKDGQELRNVAQIVGDGIEGIIKCEVKLTGKVKSVTQKPPELPNTGPGEVLALVAGMIPAGLLVKRFKSKI